MRISLTINNKETHFRCQPSDILADVLRREGYLGVKKGCDTGSCGACAVIIDKKLVNSCMIYAAACEGTSITTIEGLGTPDNPHPLQIIFDEMGAIQCGYCIPGMLLAVTALLETHPDPTDEEIKDGISGNLCRCTGYVNQIAAIKEYIKQKKEGCA